MERKEGDDVQRWRIISRTCSLFLAPPYPPLKKKVNAEEVVSLAESGREGESADGGVSVWMEDKLGLAAAELFRRHGERLPWIAVTNSGLPAYLYSRHFLGEDGKLSSFWR